MRVLVTGGGGFLGSAIVRQLLARGDEVSIVARGSYPTIEALGVIAFRGDLSSPDTVQACVPGHDAVIHTAAKAGVWGDEASYISANLTATQNLVAACQSHHVPAFIHTSTPSVTFDGTSSENGPQDLPYPATFLTHYARTKAAAEQLVLAANSNKLRTTALRPHLIWGPGDPHLVPRVVNRHRAGQLKIVGDGSNVVDLTHVENAAAAHLKALDAIDKTDGPAGKAYFISDDDPVNLWQWLNSLFEGLGLPPLTKNVSANVAYKAGATLETFHRIFRPSVEPRMTRFVAQQLSTSHWYDMTPAKTDFGYAPIVEPKIAFDELIRELSAD